MKHRRRKVLNIWGRGGGGGWGQDSEYWGGGGGKLYAGCKLIGAPAPQSVPNKYICHTEN